jgi:glycosyltransferase involved in cell wall biosynthesis
VSLAVAGAAPLVRTSQAGKLPLLVDARCLQDIVLRQRGIGRLLRTLLMRPGDSPFSPVAVLHDDFPDLAPDDAQLFSRAMRYDDSTAVEHSNQVVYLNPAPMSFDPIPTATFVASPSLRKFVICHDFIPLDVPDRFLTHPWERIRYLSQLAHLTHYDFYFTNSSATESSVRSLFAARQLNTLVIGCPVVPHLAAAGLHRQPSDRRNLFLVVGDPSFHKDVATAVRGHARFLATTTSDPIPLAVTGRIPEPQVSAFKHEHARLCGRPGLLECKGVVEDSELEQLYNSAIAVLVPSRAEGFSMPVIEAMCCGAVVVASDIDAHRSLMPQGSMLFPPGDDVALCRILTEIVPRLDLRQKIVQENDSVWTKFTAEQVARRFWERLHQEAVFQLGSPKLRRV